MLLYLKIPCSYQVYTAAEADKNYSIFKVKVDMA